MKSGGATHMRNLFFALAVWMLSSSPEPAAAGIADCSGPGGLDLSAVAAPSVTCGSETPFVRHVVVHEGETVLDYTGPPPTGNYHTQRLDDSGEHFVGFYLSRYRCDNGMSPVWVPVIGDLAAIAAQVKAWETGDTPRPDSDITIEFVRFAGRFDAQERCVGGAPHDCTGWKVTVF